MSIGSFFKLVEIQTKVASVIPFLLGAFYALYRFDSFNSKNFLLMLGSLLCIDMATTSINNYYDFKRANKKYGYGYESHNAIVKYKLSEAMVLGVIFTLFIIATVLGILLFLNTNLVVLVLGVVSFAIGVLYSFGPLPVSRTPFGELFSGGMMGFLIPFISAYIHIPHEKIADIWFNNETTGMFVNIQINIYEVIYIVLISMPAVIGIANIMLANNICDMEDDIENKRYTLPFYIGKKNGLLLFKLLYYVAYLFLIASIALGILHLISLITLLTFIIVNKHIKAFEKKQSKKDTFVFAVKNFVIINVVLVLSIALSIVL